MMCRDGTCWALHCCHTRHHSSPIIWSRACTCSCYFFLAFSFSSHHNGCGDWGCAPLCPTSSQHPHHHQSRSAQPEMQFPVCNHCGFCKSSVVIWGNTMLLCVVLPFFHQVRQATCWLFVFPVLLTPCRPRPLASCATYTDHACDLCPTYIDHACEAEQHPCACVLPLHPCQLSAAHAAAQWQPEPCCLHIS